MNSEPSVETSPGMDERKLFDDDVTDDLAFDFLNK
jgi:hypothetical protein